MDNLRKVLSELKESYSEEKVSAIQKEVETIFLHLKENFNSNDKSLKFRNKLLIALIEAKLKEGEFKF